MLARFRWTLDRPALTARKQTQTRSESITTLQMQTKLGAKWAQNLPVWAQIEGWLVSKGSRINVNFAVFWSGRWESNPRPKLGKLLYCHCTTPALFLSILPAI